MSAPVDVLAVMDRAFGAAHEHYDDLRSAANEPALGAAYDRACRYMKEHREARAAVADLIEALEGLDEAYCRAGPQLTRDERMEDRKRLVAARAALARVKGGAA